MLSCQLGTFIFFLSSFLFFLFFFNDDVNSLLMLFFVLEYLVLSDEIEFEVPANGTVLQAYDFGGGMIDIL